MSDQTLGETPRVETSNGTTSDVAGGRLGDSIVVEPSASSGDPESTDSASPTPHPPSIVRQFVPLVPGAVLGLLIMWTGRVRIGNREQFTLFDDAMISMSYARTLARGGGLVWFEGAPRVEGITNPLWTLFMSLLHVTGLSPSVISALVSLTGIAAVLLTAYLCGMIARRLTPNPTYAQPATAASVALCAPLLLWSARGMETGIIAALTAASIVLAMSIKFSVGDRHLKRVLLASLFVAGIWTRLDFAIVAIVTAGWLAWPSGPGRRLFNTAARLLLVIFLAIAAITAWRLVYYGSALPNTYYLKVSGHDSAERVLRGLETSLKLLPILLLGVAGAYSLLRRSSAPRRHNLLLVGAVAATVLAYNVYVGGDAWEDFPNRFVLPFVVLMLVLAICGASTWSKDDAPGRTALMITGWLFVAAAGVVFLTKSIPEEWTSGPLMVVYSIAGPLALFFVAGISRDLGSKSGGANRSTTWLIACSALLASSGFTLHLSISAAVANSDNTASMASFGLQLREIVEPDGTIAVVWAGAPVYYSDRDAVDLLGKNDPVIARSVPKTRFWPGHDKWDYKSSIERSNPDVVAQLWYSDAADEEYLESRGYSRRCLRDGRGSAEVWIRNDSSKADRNSALFEPCQD